MPRTKLGSEFRRRVNGWIDISSDPVLCCCQRAHNILKRCVPDDQQVDVTGGAEFTAGSGAEHESDLHAFTEWFEGLAEHVGEPGSLREQSLQLRKDRRLAIGLEIDLPALNRAEQQSGGSQLLQLALYGANGGSGVARDLAKIVRFVGVTEQPAEDTPPRTAEQQCGDVCRARRGNGGCSHNENNRTQIGNTASIVQSADIRLEAKVTRIMLAISRVICL
jgi:hypothetical protein